LDYDQFKKHELRNWVEGANSEEKFKTVTRGRSEKATFTHFIEYGTDLICRLCKKLKVVEPVVVDDQSA